ncbi:hypothetical protein BDC45DRAFT_576232 [Circinella umbellata]|nr:hypothetical protein BDC45DRAFT_576232 [Circinella umbellata]
MIDFLPFLPQGHDGVTNEIYQIARNAWLFQLKTLLDAENDQEFMVELTNNESLHEFIASVLNNQLDGNITDSEISKRVFFVYVRAARLHSIDNPLFTPEQLSSFAVIYGESNPSHVRTLFSQVLVSNSKLASQLDETIGALAVCFESATASSDLDRLYVIARLLEALVSATIAFNKNKNDITATVLQSILKCYNDALQKPTKGKIDSTITTTSTLYRIKCALLETWNHIMDVLYLNPLLTASKNDADEIIDVLSEKMLHWIEESNIEQTRQGFVDAPLIMDWIVTFSVDEKLDEINKKRFQGDDERIEFLKLLTEQKKGKSVAMDSKREQSASGTISTIAQSFQQADDIHEVANISQIHDLFPELGEGFIRACLKHHNNDVEVVIMQLLDDDLPEPLNTLDRTLKELPPSAGQVISLDENRQPSILDSRRNIFDNDEFDLLSRETISVNKSKIHMGPRDRGTADTMLQDQSFIKSEKENVLQRIHKMYEDEYDDTYDDINDLSGPVDLDAVENDDALDVVKSNNKSQASTNIIESEGDLVSAYVDRRDLFHRSNRKLPARQALQKKTGMSEEQIEGWAIMMDRNPRRQRILDRYMLFDGNQTTVDNSTKTTQASNSKQRSQKQPQRSGPENEQRQRSYKDKNKARFGNHNRKKGHDKKMVKAGVAGPSA